MLCMYSVMLSERDINQAGKSVRAVLRQALPNLQSGDCKDGF
jgi:hypothetical protein